MIEVRHLSKSYGNHPALSDVSFTIEKGHIYGFLGPNGAGKSTTMNILCGCLAPTSGEVLVNGHDIIAEPIAAKRCLGYLPELPPLYPEMTPREYLRFVGEMKGLRGQALRDEVEAVMKTVGITEVSNRLIRQLSKGFRQRTGVAQAVLGHPEVIVLDEPCVGLDPRQIIEIRGLIRSLGREHTVILSSHILSEVREVCDRIIIISAGRIAAVDTPEHLERRFAAGRTLELTVKGTPEQIEAVCVSLPEVSSAEVRELGGGRCSVSLGMGAEDISEPVFSAFAAAALPILSMNTVSATLEDVFLELTDADGNAGEEDDHAADL